MTTLFPTTTVECVGKGNFDVYIGRKIPRRFEESPFHNPFKIGYDGERKEVLLAFLEYWYAPEQKALRDIAVKELSGKILGCWCSPFSCHGDFIAGYVNWKKNEKI